MMKNVEIYERGQEYVEESYCAVKESRIKLAIDDSINIDEIINGTLLYTIDNEKEPQIYYTLKLDE